MVGVISERKSIGVVGTRAALNSAIYREFIGSLDPKNADPGLGIERDNDHPRAMHVMLEIDASRPRVLIFDGFVYDLPSTRRTYYTYLALWLSDPTDRSPEAKGATAAGTGFRLDAPFDGPRWTDQINLPSVSLPAIDPARTLLHATIGDVGSLDDTRVCSMVLAYRPVDL